MSEWISVEKEVPSLAGKADYSCQELVIAFTCFGDVRPMYYARQMYNKTEKGREPRWEDMQGAYRIATYTLDAASATAN